MFFVVRQTVVETTIYVHLNFLPSEALFLYLIDVCSIKGYRILLLLGRISQSIVFPEKVALEFLSIVHCVIVHVM